MVEKIIVACSMLDEEIKQSMKELALENSILFIEAALHVDFDLLEASLLEKIEEAKSFGRPVVILVGNKCHPEIEKIANNNNCRISMRANCIELLLGEELKQLDNEAKTFYITNGWLKKWRDIFVTGLRWDSIDARQNFGFYDRVLLLDSGNAVDDEELLEFFEYTQIPIETYSITLDNLKKEILNLLKT